MKTRFTMVMKSWKCLRGLCDMELYKIRKEKELSREKLAKFSNVSHCEIYKLEKGLIQIEDVKFGTLLKLADTLNCKVIDLLPKHLHRKLR